MGKLKRVIICVIVFAMLVTGLGPATLHPQAAAKVKLNTTKVTLSVGDTKQLKVSGTKKKVTWSSSKKSVATVSKKGKVTAKKAGTATITAKVGKKKLTCKVTVSKMRVVKISKLTGADADMDPGEKIQLTLATDKKITWSSDNKKVATVNKTGVVTAKEPGYAMIKAKYGKTWIACYIKVKLDDQIQLNTTSIVLYRDDFYPVTDDSDYMAKYGQYMDGNYKIKLTASYASGRKCNNKDFIWLMDEDYLPYPINPNDAIITVKSDGTIIPEKYGTTKVWVEDRLSGTKACCEVTVKSKIEEDCEVKARSVIAEVIKAGMTDAEKVLEIHDWICNNVFYGDTKTINGVYSCLFDGTGQCGDYAVTFEYFMKLLNIPCVTVHSGKMFHAWNQVQLNGKWYWLDVQADDAGYKNKNSKEIKYVYFLNVGYQQSDETRTEYVDIDSQAADTDKGVTYTAPWSYNQGKDYKYTSKYNPHVDGIILPE